MLLSKILPQTSKNFTQIYLPYLRHYETLVLEDGPSLSPFEITKIFNNLCHPVFTEYYSGITYFESILLVFTNFSLWSIKNVDSVLQLQI